MKSRHITALILAALCLLAPASAAWACTSMLVSAKASATGRPLMWKHRDTGAEHNFVERVDATKGGHAYVALFNGGDSLLAEAWMGMNDAGFAIMNTASYNLAPDTAQYADREGEVMSRALAQCVTVGDFESLLRSYPKPMGVQANFGVMDAQGGIAYFETNDHTFTRYDVPEDGYLIRTNHSMSGNDTDGMGYVRYANAQHVLRTEIEEGCFTPMAFTEKASRSFYHSLIGRDFEQGDDRWVVDQDFIPRSISTASIVIEGINEGADPSDMVMWTAIGYPPLSSVLPVTLLSVPDCLRPLCPGYTCQMCQDVLALKSHAFPLTVANGPRYIDMGYLRRMMPQMRAKSMEEYRKHYSQESK